MKLNLTLYFFDNY